MAPTPQPLSSPPSTGGAASSTPPSLSALLSATRSLLSGPNGAASAAAYLNSSAAAPFENDARVWAARGFVLSKVGDVDAAAQAYMTAAKLREEAGESPLFMRGEQDAEAEDILQNLDEHDAGPVVSAENRRGKRHDNAKKDEQEGRSGGPSVSGAVGERRNGPLRRLLNMSGAAFGLLFGGGGGNRGSDRRNTAGAVEDAQERKESSANSRGVAGELHLLTSQGGGIVRAAERDREVREGDVNPVLKSVMSDAVDKTGGKENNQNGSGGSLGPCREVKDEKRNGGDDSDDEPSMDGAGSANGGGGDARQASDGYASTGPAVSSGSEVASGSDGSGNSGGGTDAAGTPAGTYLDDEGNEWTCSRDTCKPGSEFGSSQPSLFRASGSAACTLDRCRMPVYAACVANVYRRPFPRAEVCGGQRHRKGCGPRLRRRLRVAVRRGRGANHATCVGRLDEEVENTIGNRSTRVENVTIGPSGLGAPAVSSSVTGSFPSKENTSAGAVVGKDVSSSGRSAAAVFQPLPLIDVQIQGNDASASTNGGTAPQPRFACPPQPSLAAIPSAPSGSDGARPSTSGSVGSFDTNLRRGLGNMWGPKAECNGDSSASSTTQRGQVLGSSSSLAVFPVEQHVKGEEEDQEVKATSSSDEIPPHASGSNKRRRTSGNDGYGYEAALVRSTPCESDDSVPEFAESSDEGESSSEEGDDCEDVEVKSDSLSVPTVHSTSSSGTDCPTPLMTDDENSQGQPESMNRGGVDRRTAVESESDSVSDSDSNSDSDSDFDAESVPELASSDSESMMSDNEGSMGTGGIQVRNPPCSCENCGVPLVESEAPQHVILEDERRSGRDTSAEDSAESDCDSTLDDGRRFWGGPHVPIDSLHLSLDEVDGLEADSVPDLERYPDTLPELERYPRDASGRDGTVRRDREGGSSLERDDMSVGSSPGLEEYDGVPMAGSEENESSRGNAPSRPRVQVRSGHLHVHSGSLPPHIASIAASAAEALGRSGATGVSGRRGGHTHSGPNSESHREHSRDDSQAQQRGEQRHSSTERHQEPQRHHSQSHSERSARDLNQRGDLNQRSNVHRHGENGSSAPPPSFPPDHERLMSMFVAALDSSITSASAAGESTGPRGNDDRSDGASMEGRESHTHHHHHSHHVFHAPNGARFNVHQTTRRLANGEGVFDAFDDVTDTEAGRQVMEMVLMGQFHSVLPNGIPVFMEDDATPAGIGLGKEFLELIAPAGPVRDEATGAVACVICTEPLRNSDVRHMPCEGSHIFHAECIDQWLAGHSTCPTCRTDFSEYPLTQEP